MRFSVSASNSKTPLRGVEVSRLGRTPFTHRNERRHLSLPSSAQHLFLQHWVFSVNILCDWGCCGRVWGWGGRSGALQLECSSLYVQNSSWPRPATSQAPSWRKGVALRASRALAAPHPRAQAGPAVEWSQKASGHLPAPKNHFLASFHLQQVPIVHYPDKNRCLTVFLARLTPDHTINTSWSERAGLDWKISSSTRFPTEPMAWKGAEQGLFALQLCGTAHHITIIIITSPTNHPFPVQTSWDSQPLIFGWLFFHS